MLLKKSVQKDFSTASVNSSFNSEGSVLPLQLRYCCKTILGGLSEMLARATSEDRMDKRPMPTVMLNPQPVKFGDEWYVVATYPNGQEERILKRLPRTGLLTTQKNGADDGATLMSDRRRKRPHDTNQLKLTHYPAAMAKGDMTRPDWARPSVS
jgi:hypothetical protein